MIDSAVDWFRVANAGLALAAALLLLFSSNGPWRSSLSTLRMFSASVAGVFLWQAYTSVEAARDLGPASPNGIRVYGFTIIYSVVVLSLIVERFRSRKIRHAVTMNPVIVTRPRS